MDRLDYYHCAKLSLFNVRLLCDLERARASEPVVDRLIRQRARSDSLSEPVSLMHQTTFLGHAYVMLVWMHEYVYKTFKKNEKKRFKRAFSQRFDIEGDTVRLHSELSTDKDHGEDATPRDLTKRYEFFRTLRNAIAHARVEIGEGTFAFINDGKKDDVVDTATVEMTWEQLGKLVDAVLFAYTDILYPPESS